MSRAHTHTTDGNAVDPEETIELLQTLVSLNTVDPPGNERDAALAVREVLERESIETALYDLGDNRANLVARLRGSGERPALIFSAHLDTIDVEESQWTVDPFGGEIRDGKLYGRGATDMKGGLAAMAAAAIDLKRRNVTLAGDLVLAFSAAENSTGMGARELLQSGEFAGAGAMVISEPTCMDIFIAEKGALWLRATASGGSGHAPFVTDWRGDYENAIIRMAEFIVSLKTLPLSAPEHPHLTPPSLSVGVISGGILAAVIPGSCTADIDVRMLPGMDPEAVRAEVQALAGEHIAIDILDFKVPVETPADDPFVLDCAAAYEATLGTRPAVTGVSYFTDATIYGPALGIPIAIIGPGVVGHSGVADEYVKVQSVLDSAAVFAGIAEQYLGGRG